MSEATPHDPPEQGRSARKRKAIMEAATTVFLRHGYLGTSMDEIAATAVVSKQTVYKHFADKKRLFTDIVLDRAGGVDEVFGAVTSTLRDTNDLDKDLGQLARQFITFLTQPHMLQLRRLVIGEAGRFPDLGRSYYERGPERVHAGLASALQHLAQRGLLRIDDPLTAANHFTWLVTSIPVNKAMFCGDDVRFTEAELESYADAAVDTFLRAYRNP
jgi:TetR/AcrR family transcriptional repressor of mexJK operon